MYLEAVLHPEILELLPVTYIQTHSESTRLFKAHITTSWTDCALHKISMTMFVAQYPVLLIGATVCGTEMSAVILAVLKEALGAAVPSTSSCDSHMEGCKGLGVRGYLKLVTATWRLQIAGMCRHD